MRIFLSLIAFIFAGNLFAADFKLSSTSIAEEGPIPVLYTCDGKDISPQLNWKNSPANTKSYALIMTDPDAPSGTFYHWVVYNIPAATKEISEGEKMPTGTSIGKNSWNKLQYNGPCPPKGSVHHYIFSLYALDSKLTLPAGADGPTVEKKMKDHTLQATQLKSIYSRWAS